MYLADVADHDHEADRELRLVAEHGRRDRDGGAPTVRTLELALDLALPFRELGVEATQQLADPVVDQRLTRCADHLREGLVHAADATVHMGHRDAVRQRIEDLVGEGAGREQRVAVAIEAPRDRRCEDRHRRAAEARRLEAGERQQGIGRRGHHQRNEDSAADEQRLIALALRRGVVGATAGRESDNDAAYREDEIDDVERAHLVGPAPVGRDHLAVHPRREERGPQEHRRDRVEAAVHDPPLGRRLAGDFAHQVDRERTDEGPAQRREAEEDLRGPGVALQVPEHLAERPDGDARDEHRREAVRAVPRVANEDRGREGRSRHGGGQRDQQVQIHGRRPSSLLSVGKRVPLTQVSPGSLRRSAISRCGGAAATRATSHPSRSTWPRPRRRCASRARSRRSPGARAGRPR